VDTHAAESGFRLPRRHDLLGLIALTWLFFFRYGPVEDALPVYVAHDLHAHARLLGAYWTSFGIGALASTLLTGARRGHGPASHHTADRRWLGRPSRSVRVCADRRHALVLRRRRLREVTARRPSLHLPVRSGLPESGCSGARWTRGYV
jgi:hypothetical protein